MTWTHKEYCVIDNHITQKEATRKPGITERQFRRILKRSQQS